MFLFLAMPQDLLPLLWQGLLPLLSHGLAPKSLLAKNIPSINFPLILVLATGITGLIWLLDHLFLRPKREAALEAAGDVSEDQKEKILAEPVLVEYSISFFPVLAIVLVLRSFLFVPFQSLL